jgi:hypothetical protein
MSCKSGNRSSSCRNTGGRGLNYEPFLYMHTQLPGGEFIAFRMRIVAGQIVTCYRHRQSR